MEESAMHGRQQSTHSGELDSLDMDAEHVMPPELPTQDSALEDSVGQLSRVQNKLVDTLHALQLLPPHLVKDHNRAVRAIQEALTLVGDTDDSEAIGPIDWVKFGDRLLQRRTAAGLTQEWLADRVGVTATTIRQLEHHNRKARRSLMLKLLAVPELNLRVSDIELSAEMSAGYRLTPTSWLGPTYDPVGMVTELAETLNGQSGQLEQTLVYIDPQSAKDWMTTCSSPEYGPEYRDSMPLATMARRIADLIVGEQALTVNALGCGDGRTEALLTKYLQQTLRMPKQTELFLLDVSHSLLNAAYRHCCETLPDIRTYTIHGSFLDLPKMPMLVNPLRGRSRLFAMLGGTLLNLTDELRYFRDTLSCCAPGELFLCDVLIARAPSQRPTEDPQARPDWQRQAPTLPRNLAEWPHSSLLPRCRGCRASLGAGAVRWRSRQLRLRCHRPSQDARRQTRSPLPDVASPSLRPEAAQREPRRARLEDHRTNRLRPRWKEDDGADALQKQ
jgi:transcriptional regulator with XRE-family HTH domain